jgi:hypothetical protein
MRVCQGPSISKHSEYDVRMTDDLRARISFFKGQIVSVLSPTLLRRRRQALSSPRRQESGEGSHPPHFYRLSLQSNKVKGRWLSLLVD